MKIIIVARKNRARTKLKMREAERLCENQFTLINAFVQVMMQAWYVDEKLTISMMRRYLKFMQQEEKIRRKRQEIEVAVRG